jgi:hypothetical protein
VQALVRFDDVHETGFPDDGVAKNVTITKASTVCDMVQVLGAATITGDFNMMMMMPLYHYTIMPLYHYTIIPSYHHTIIPLYHHTIKLFNNNKFFFILFFVFWGGIQKVDLEKFWISSSSLGRL